MSDLLETIAALEKTALRIKAERDILFDAIEKIARLDPAVDSKDGHNEWGEAECFLLALDIAIAALSKMSGEK